MSKVCMKTRRRAGICARGEATVCSKYGNSYSIALPATFATTRNGFSTRLRIHWPDGDPMQPLTALSEEDALFRASVREFARAEITPHVRSMDAAGHFREDLLAKCFQLGLMGIEI